MFDHIQIKVSDFKRSRIFYQVVLEKIGYAVVFEDIGVVGFGTSPHDMFEVRQEDSGVNLSKSVHVAFLAKSREAVDLFYATALIHGAKDNGAPGLRPGYEQGYYAAFVTDPDGHNLEAVFSEKSVQ